MNFCFSRFGVWSDDFEFRSQDGGHLKDYFGIKYFFSDSHCFQMARVERSVSFLWDSMVYEEPGYYTINPVLTLKKGYLQKYDSYKNSEDSFGYLRF